MTSDASASYPAVLEGSGKQIAGWPKAVRNQPRRALVHPLLPRVERSCRSIGSVDEREPSVRLGWELV